MKETIIYQCSICGEEYDNKEEALSCEKMHTLCACEQNKSYTIYYSPIGSNNTTSIKINYRKKTIDYLYKPYDSSVWYLKKSTSICFCPFCGKQLQEIPKYQPHYLEAIIENFVDNSLDYMDKAYLGSDYELKYENNKLILELDSNSSEWWLIKRLKPRIETFLKERNINDNLYIKNKEKFIKEN